ncbi:GAF domain-containing sensor histidine kinase [Lusitaniella coriacea]|uniref:GAF domain-containing sensor histidine kinase n=1 Tax=Lusitaniella coriacea TaxID=1983105 RepID=UPI001D13E804|nr:ATP-binding protein [Lusitaniella coriacea]
MPHSPSLLAHSSSEFVDLCQSQVALLTQGLGAAWCGVYLTEDLVQSAPKLIPIVVYPDAREVWSWEEGKTQEGELSPLLALSQQHLLDTPGSHQEQDVINEREPFTGEPEEESFQPGYQVARPLIYQEGVMGLLVAGRRERKWTPEELIQIDRVARTLAIARSLDRQQRWYRQQLHKQENLRHIQQEVLDNLLHQLRNPMTALRTFSKLLLKRLRFDDANRTVAEGIVRESDRLQGFLQQLDDYFKTVVTESSLLPPADPLLLPGEDQSVAPYLLPGKAIVQEPLALEAILQPLILSAQTIAQERGLTLKAVIPARLPLVCADPWGIREVLSNLIDNALKYTPRGGCVEIEAGLTRSTPHGTLQGVAVRDNGLGIPLGDRERIFERHYRGVQEQGEISGSGLGLAIAKNLIEQMHGEIELVSPNPDAANPSSGNPGTTFIVWLPVDGK